MKDMTTSVTSGEQPVWMLSLDQLRDLIRAEMQAALGQNDRGGDRLLTVEEAAAKLQKSKYWIYEHAAKLPFMQKVGRNWRCSDRVLEKWLASRRSC